MQKQSEEQAQHDRHFLQNLPQPAVLAMLDNSGAGESDGSDALNLRISGSGRDDLDDETKNHINLGLGETKHENSSVSNDDLREPMLNSNHHAERITSDKVFMGALGHVVGTLKAQVND